MSDEQVIRARIRQALEAQAREHAAEVQRLRGAYDNARKEYLDSLGLCKQLVGELKVTHQETERLREQVLAAQHEVDQALAEVQALRARLEAVEAALHGQGSSGP